MTEYRGYTYEIEQDQDSESPREWDNVGKMVCSHKRYNLPNEIDFDFDAHGSWAEVEAVLRKRYAVVLPVFMFDHSGLTFSVESHQFQAADPQRWDWGQVGFIVATANDIKSGWLLPRNRKLGTGDLVAARAALRSEIETYNQWSSGDVWRYVVTGPDGDEVESCGGFYGEESAEEEAKSEIDSLWQGSQTVLFLTDLGAS